MIKTKYTIEHLTEIVRKSTSINNTVFNLGLKTNSGNNRYIKKLILLYNIDISHFNTCGTSKGKKFGPKRDLKDYLNNIYPINSHNLKLRLVKENVLEYKCSICNLDSWMDREISLHLDHIDGNHYNNNLDNLRILCPNCHSQTNTYSGKNSKKIKNITICIDCNCKISNKRTRCIECAKIARNFSKNKCPSIDCLKQDIIDLNSNFSKIGRKYNVSPTSVRRWCKKYKLI